MVVAVQVQLKVELKTLKYKSLNKHSGWVCKRVCNTFKDGSPICKVQVSKNNGKCIEVGKQYIMDLINNLGEDISL